MGQENPVLKVSDLSVAFLPQDVNAGWRTVLSGVDFELGKRETVALVGGSGSGKSVTSLAIMRLLDPKRARVSGRIDFNGRNLLELPEQEMRAIRGNGISMIFQEPMTSLNPVVTVGKQVAETLIAHKGLGKAEAYKRATELLDRVKIPSAASRLGDYPHQFSGGQRQRVLIAIALACDPDVLIADEPTTALDVTVQAQILELIADLQAERDMSVLFITHDMGVVAQVADRTIVMHRGAMVETGSTPEIFAAPVEAYTKSLLAAVPKLGSMKGFPRPVRFPTVDLQSGLVQDGRETEDTVDAKGAPLLSVTSLAKFYGGKGGFRRAAAPVRAVEDVTFEVRAGETLALVGESGCGKSTTGRTIIRLQDPTSGEILFDGEDLGSLRGAVLRDRRTQIQMIFQDPFASLNPRMTVGDALAEPLLAHNLVDRREAAQKVATILDLVGLDPASAIRLPHEFSGGQRQRVSIARALMLNPRLIVADEVVSALDVVVKAQVVNLLMDLQEKLKLAFLFISHDMAVVERVSHRVAVMRMGRIVEIGPRASIFENPQHPYTRQLLAAAPLPDPLLRPARGTKRPTPPPIAPAKAMDAMQAMHEVGPDHFVRA
ncbi:MAG: ABC transporter ATP-binding protein [Pseudomonadota bacterium]